MKRSSLITMRCFFAIALVKPAASSTTLLNTGVYCSNRGGSGGSNSMSVNVGTFSHGTCDAAVVANPECGNFYSYGQTDGWCDCVPCGETSCIEAAHPVYKAYSNDISNQACPTLHLSSVRVLPKATARYYRNIPSQIDFTATTVNVLPAASAMTFTADYPIWLRAKSMAGCSVTTGGSSDSTTFATEATDTSTFVATVQAGESVAAGVEVVFTCYANFAEFATGGTTVTFTSDSFRHSPLGGLAGWITVDDPNPFFPPLEADMPCSTLACPAGYEHRWNAGSVLCSGACNATEDVSLCCVLVGFSSHQWRIQAASEVSEAWDLAALRFYLSDNCSADSDSLVDTAPGFNHRWRGWPNGAAFSHHGGRGAVAAELLVDPKSFPSSPPAVPNAIRWSSGAPCAAGDCFFGYAWESEVDRYPQGACTASQRSTCSTAEQLRKKSLRIACVEVEQSEVPGRFAEKLRLQLLDTSSDNESSPGIWRA